MNYIIEPVFNQTVAFCNGCKCNGGNCNCDGGSTTYTSSNSSTAK